MTSREVVLDAARAAAGDAPAAVKLAAALTRPEGASAAIELLYALAEVDLTVARVVEPHLDALTILAEADLSASDGVYGVFAAEAPGLALTARHDGDQWYLSGVKPWCSLASLLDHALVTATTPTGRGLFEVDLHHLGVEPVGAAWVARGLTTVVTSDLALAEVPARPVGADDWYLTRAGFAWGGIRVAACWAGAAHALVASLRSRLAERRPVDLIPAANLGRADIADWTARLALDHAARTIDQTPVTPAEATLLAARTRAVVADAAEVVLREVGHALGPAPLAFDEIHVRRVADLTLYIRQHHAERDLAALGSLTTS